MKGKLKCDKGCWIVTSDTDERVFFADDTSLAGGLALAALEVEKEYDVEFELETVLKPGSLSITAPESQAPAPVSNLPPSQARRGSRQRFAKRATTPKDKTPRGEVRKEPAAADDDSGSKIFAGFELTFCNALTIADFKEKEFQAAAVGAANRFMEDLNEHFAGHRQTYLRKLNELLSEVAEKRGCDPEFLQEANLCCIPSDRNCKDFGGSSEEVHNLRVTLNLPTAQRSVPDGFAAERWSFNVSVDPGVFEVQTDPVLWGNDGPEEPVLEAAIAAIFEIFEVVRYRGVQVAPSPTNGGGHVNIDAAGAKVTTTAQIIDMIFLWERHRKPYLLRDDPLIEQNAQNQAVLSDTRREGYISGPNREGVGADPLSQKLAATKARKWKEATGAIKDLFFDYPQEALFHQGAGNLSESINRNAKNLESDKALVLHNQAINIEHLVPDPSGIRGRIEFREFRAQKSLGELHLCVQICRELIFKVLEAQ